MDPDADAIAKAQRGDRQAQTVVLEHYARALRYLVSKSGAGAEADDRMQDLYAKILDVLPRYEKDRGAALGTWIFAVAHNWLVEQRRRRRLKLVPLEHAPDLADERPSAEQKVAAAELRALLDGALLALSEEHRRVFVLAKIHGQPLEAIAIAEGVALGTVKSRLHRATAEVVLRLGPALDEVRKP
ncbi:MAG: sigma-70 family RNA polymerase sigma factor [Deltaproteobacteria bacterium]|nr:sigma-70 family RNA polymerase sigma factor [Deltaproteobacteria bacterium]